VGFGLDQDFTKPMPTGECHEVSTTEGGYGHHHLRRCYRCDERIEHMAWHWTSCLVTLTPPASVHHQRVGHAWPAVTRRHKQATERGMQKNGRLGTSWVPEHDGPPNIEMEPTLLPVRASMSPRRAAQAAR
jgi:hypothetical protein